MQNDKQQCCFTTKPFAPFSLVMVVWFIYWSHLPNVYFPNRYYYTRDGINTKKTNLKVFKILYTILIGIDSCQRRIFKTYRVILHFPALIIKIFILLKQCLFVFCSVSYFLLSKKEESRERVSWTRILLLWVLFFAWVLALWLWSVEPVPAPFIPNP